MDKFILKTPAEFRGVLMASAIAVIEGRMNVSQANAVMFICSITGMPEQLTRF